MNGILNETVLTLPQACSLYPGTRGASRKHPATLTRYIRKGCRGAAGVRVKLEAIRDGGRYLTSREALDRFHERLNAQVPVEPAPTNSALDRMHEATECELEKLGGFKRRPAVAK
ncbi:MAG: DUF1580 domain-containing protein [Gemmataceae bacterium]